MRNNFKEYQTNSENDINNSEFNKNNANKSNNKKNTEQEYNKKLGSFAGIVELTKELYKNKPKRDELKKITQKDIIAVILTIIVVILIGIALWFIPFTNGWMREFLFENPLFNWIGNLFS